MYVPIVIDPCAFYEYRYLWEYLKYEYHCYKNHWPLIAEECYEVYREKRPISNVYDDEFCKLHQYEVLSSEEEKEVKKYFIPDYIFQELEKRCGSKLGMKLFLLKNRYKPLEKELYSLIRRIQKDTGVTIQGFLCWNSSYVSIRYVAKKMRLPLITNEFALRFPEYYPLGYMCKNDIYEQEEIEHMYNKFLQEKNKMKFELLSREELLALFLTDERLDCIKSVNLKEEYEIGIAGCHPLIATFFAKSTYTDLELIQDVRTLYSEKDILFRKHPGDEPYQANYTLLNRDKSIYASEFIRKCKRITAVGSNTLLEALLWGKKVYSRDISPYTMFCERNLECKEFECISDDVLNFILFAFLVPYNKMFDEEYIGWRYKEKNVIKIIEKNIRYYFHEMDIPLEILEIQKEERYKVILERRNCIYE